MISTGGEEGLLGLAFHPNYASTGYFYVYYSAANPRRSVVERYSVSADNSNQANTNSGEIIIEIEQPFSNHNGGTIAFGPDGYLYIGLGDGGDSGDPNGNGQNRNTLLASMLRIDPNTLPYLIPTDNPYVGEGDSVREEIWAYGLRNPYRFSFDRTTGGLWLADVGQGEMEEIDIIRKGANYGWNIFEGTLPYSGDDSSNLEMPIYEYDHTVGQSITGGNVYRGSIVSLQGAYIYADFISTGKVFALFTDRNNNYELIFNEEIPTGNFNISGFGEDEAGELYIVSYYGTLYRFAPTSTKEETTAIPKLLSETGIFRDPISNLEVNPGIIEYTVNTALWSDNAKKRRWLSIPGLTDTIDFTSSGSWVFPTGTIMVKHFEMQLAEANQNSLHKLETRILLKQQNGWKGFTYKWRDDESDADLLDGLHTEDLTIVDYTGTARSQSYSYPSPANCMACHTQLGGPILGVRTKQLNTTFNDTNQLTQLSDMGYFSQTLESPENYGEFYALDHIASTTSQQSRSYLDVHCANCHRPGGTAPVKLDLRFETLDSEMNAIGLAPQAGDLGAPNAELISVSSKEESVLWLRLNSTDNHRMPPVGSNVIDADAIAIIGQWIDELTQ